jgi:flavin-dependent dehydrogenase
MPDYNYDVIIAGGGPAGSSAAAHLAQMGYKVAVFEKEKFPRDHVGESLIPFCYGHLKKLGVLDQMKKIAVRKPGINFVSADSEHRTTWCFASTLKDPSQLSYHMLRSTFDKMLLDNSKLKGAAVFEEYKIVDVDLSSAEKAVVTVENKSGQREVHHSRFLIDATGQNTFLAPKVGKKVSYPGLDRVALFSHWSGNKFDRALQNGLIKIVYLGGEKIGWCWMIPVGKDLLSIGVTLNNSYVKQKKAEYSHYGAEWKTHLYEDEIRSSAEIQSIISNGQRTHDVIVMGDYSYSLTKRYDTNFAIIGDAAAFLDPIFSSGIYVAFESAERTAIAIQKLFENSTEEGLSSLENHYAHMDKSYRLLEKFIRLFYKPEVMNFALVGNPEKLMYYKFEAAYTIFHNLLAGDFFTNADKYSDFIDDIEKNNWFQKYVTLAHSKELQFGPDACEETAHEVYGHMDESLLDLPQLVH